MAVVSKVDPVRKYEAVILMHPNSSEEDQKKLFRKNRDIIKKFSGAVNHLDTWGPRRLANPINKLTKAVYFHTTFEATGSCIHELERTMRLNDHVLGFTHIRLDDRTDLGKYVEAYKNTLAEVDRREKEREAKQKKSAQARKK